MMTERDLREIALAFLWKALVLAGFAVAFFVLGVWYGQNHPVSTTHVFCSGHGWIRMTKETVRR